MFTIRHPVEGDIKKLLEIEFDRYQTLYREHPGKLRQVENRFKKRLSIARKWMWVLEQEGDVLGFITGLPTNDDAEDFKSWELSTNYGTLEGKYNPDGRNVYVVNLDVKREATRKNGQYLLMSALGSKAITQGKNKVIFESRMPGFRDWMKENEKAKFKAWNKLSKSEQQTHAEKYASLTTMVSGQEVLYDRLLRFYENSGFTFIKVYPNAFEDNESLNFGVLCVGHNPVPKSLRVVPINQIAGWLFKTIGRNQKLFEKLVG